MAAVTDALLLEHTINAIDAIVLYGRRVKVGDKEYSRESLGELRALRRELESRTGAAHGIARNYARRSRA